MYQHKDERRRRQKIIAGESGNLCFVGTNFGEQTGFILSFEGLKTRKKRNNNQ